MNPRDLFDRLDAGYKYDAMYGELCNERDQLKAENAKLREERDTYRDLVGYMVHPDIPDQLAAENVELRDLCIDFASMLTYADLDGLRVEATIGGSTKTYDASELCDKVEELFDEVS